MEFRELGLISILIMWGACAYLLTKWRGKKHMSISLHAASARSAYYFFAIVQTVSVSLFAIFMFKWFIPQFQLDTIFQILFTFTLICLYATLLIPDINVHMRRLHRLFAFTMADMLFVIIAYVLTTCSLSFTTQFIGGAALAYMTFCIFMFLKVKKIRDHFFMRNYLSFQVIYLVVFQIFILVATYGG